MKKFRIFKADGKQQYVNADSVEWKRGKTNLHLKFSTGKKVTQKFDDAILLVEVSEPIIESSPAQNENEQDD